MVVPFKAVTAEEMFTRYINEYFKPVVQTAINSLDSNLSDEEIVILCERIRTVCHREDIDDKIYYYEDWRITGNDERGIFNTQLDFGADNSFIRPYYKKMALLTYKLLSLCNNSGENLYPKQLKEIFDIENPSKEWLILKLKEVGDELFKLNGVFDQIILMAQQDNWAL